MKKAIFDTSSYRDSTMVSYLAKKLAGEEEPEKGGNMATLQAREKEISGFYSLMLPPHPEHSLEGAWGGSM